MQPKTSTTARNSNVELLRILCMLMVVVLHFNNNGANTGIVNMPSVLTPSLSWGFLVESLCIVAVNCFVLISGYFGISLRLRSLLKFYLQCFFIGFISYLLYLWLSPATLSWTILFERLLAFTHNGWWFVVSYLGLMLLSPVLNAAVENLSKKQMLLATALCGVIVLYLGWYQQVEPTHNGCSLLNFIFVYLVGRCVGKHLPLGTIQRHRWSWLVGYLLSAMSIFGLVMLRYHCHLVVRYVYDYNHPLVLMAALMLFLFFLSFSFNSKGINWLASSLFAAYLFQESTFLGHQYLYPQMESFFHHYVPQTWNIALLFIVSIVFVAICIVADKLIHLLSMPILTFYDHVVEKLTLKTNKK